MKYLANHPVSILMLENVDTIDDNSSATDQSSSFIDVTLEFTPEPLQEVVHIMEHQGVSRVALGMVVFPDSSQNLGNKVGTVELDDNLMGALMEIVKQEFTRNGVVAPEFSTVQIVKETVPPLGQTMAIEDIEDTDERPQDRKPSLKLTTPDLTAFTTFLPSGIVDKDGVTQPPNGVGVDHRLVFEVGHTSTGTAQGSSAST